MDLVHHRGKTVGFRIEQGGASMAYLPDHEPALGPGGFPPGDRRTSGYDLAAGVDLLVHDAQYSADEYPDHEGWGHSSIEHAIRFASLTGAKRLVAFHHDPGRTDAELGRMIDAAVERERPSFPVTPAAEGDTFELS